MSVTKNPCGLMSSIDNRSVPVQLNALRLQGRMHNAVMPSRIDLIRHRRLSVREHRRKRTAEDPLVGRERGSALAVKAEVRADTHVFSA